MPAEEGDSGTRCSRCLRLSSSVDASGLCLRCRRDDSSRSKTSSRLARDLDQLNSFLESVEGTSAPTRRSRIPRDTHRTALPDAEESGNLQMDQSSGSSSSWGDVSRRSSSTGLHGLLQKRSSDEDATPKSSDWKRKSDEWKDGDGEEENAAGGRRGVISERSTRLQTDADDWKDQRGRRKRMDERREAAAQNGERKKVEAAVENGEMRGVEAAVENGEMREVEAAVENGERREVEAAVENGERREVEAAVENGERMEVEAARNGEDEMEQIAIRQQRKQEEEEEREEEEDDEKENRDGEAEFESEKADKTVGDNKKEGKRLEENGLSDWMEASNLETEKEFERRDLRDAMEASHLEREKEFERIGLSDALEASHLETEKELERNGLSGGVEVLHLETENGLKGNSENEKACRFQLSQRWFSMVSECSFLLTEDETQVARETRAAFQSLRTRVIQFEDDYRRMEGTMGAPRRASSDYDSIAFATADDDDDDDDDVSDDDADVDENKKETMGGPRRASSDNDSVEFAEPDDDVSDDDDDDDVSDDDDDDDVSDIDVDENRKASEDDEVHLGGHDLDQLLPPSSCDDREPAAARPEEGQTLLRLSRSSSERSPKRSHAPDIQRTRSEVTINRSNPTRQVTEQVKEGYRESHKESADVGCTRSDKSVGRLSRSERQRYLHPLQQFETDTRAERRRSSDWTAATGGAGRSQASAAHGERQRIPVITHTRKPTDEEAKDDAETLSRILCDDLREEVLSGANPGVVLYAIRHKPPENKAQSQQQQPNRQPSVASTAAPKTLISGCRASEGAQRAPTAAATGGQPCRSNNNRRRNVELGLRVDWRNSEDPPERGRHTGAPVNLVAWKAPAVGRAISSRAKPINGDANATKPTASAAAGVKGLSMIPPRPLLRSSPSAVRPTGRELAARQSHQKRIAKTMNGMEVVDDSQVRRTHRRTDGDAIRNRRPDGDTVGPKNGPCEILIHPRRATKGSYTILSVRALDEVVTRSRDSPQDGMVRLKEDPASSMARSKNRSDAYAIGSKNSQVDGKVLSKNRYDEYAIRSKNSPPVDGTVLSKNQRTEWDVVCNPRSDPDDGTLGSSDQGQGDDLVVASSSRERETSEGSPSDVDPTGVCGDRSSAEQTASEDGSNSPPRRSRSCDRYHGFIAFQSVHPGRSSVLSSDIDSEDSEEGLGTQRRKTSRRKLRRRWSDLATTAAVAPGSEEEFSEMFELSEELRSELQTDRPNSKRGPLPPSGRDLRKRRHNGSVELTRNDRNGDDERRREIRASDDSDEYTFVDSLSHWPPDASTAEGLCEKLVLLTESDLDSSGGPTDSTDPVRESPVEIITDHARPQQLHTATEMLLTDTESHLEYWVHQGWIHVGPGVSPVTKLATEHPFSLWLFRLVRDAVTGLNRNLRSTDIGGVRLQDQRVLVAIIVILIALLIVLLSDVYPVNRPASSRAQ